MKVERKIKEKIKDQSSSVSITSHSTSMSPTTNSRRSTSTSNQPSNSMKSSDTEVTTRLQKFLKSIDKEVLNTNEKPKTIGQEMALYGSLCKKNSAMGAIAFWKTYGSQMPLLKQMAQKYLATPGTSVPSESCFSRSAYVARKERARLSPQNLAYTVFLQDKLQSLPQ